MNELYSYVGKVDRMIELPVWAPRRPGQPGTLARAGHRGTVTVSDHPAGRPVPFPARASARKRANTDHGTNYETNTERRASAQQPAMSDKGREAIREAGAAETLTTIRLRRSFALL